jgi:hypothetical protein
VQGYPVLLAYASKGKRRKACASACATLARLPFCLLLHTLQQEKVLCWQLRSGHKLLAYATSKRLPPLVPSAAACAACCCCPVALPPLQGSPCAFASIPNNRQRSFAGGCAAGISCVAKSQRKGSQQQAKVLCLRVSSGKKLYGYPVLVATCAFYLRNATYARCASASKVPLPAVGYATQRHKGTLARALRAQGQKCKQLFSLASGYRATKSKGGKRSKGC